MYKEVTYSDELLKYWEAERNAPQWFAQAGDVWTQDAQAFKDFCKSCWKMYEIDDCALVYAVKTGQNVEVHFSILRHRQSDTLIQDLRHIRQELFNEFKMVWGWVVKQNRGIKTVCRQLGMQFNGVKMLHGQIRDRVIEWHCYIIRKTDFLVVTI